MSATQPRWLAPVRCLCRAASVLSLTAFVALAATTALAAPGSAAPAAGAAQVVTPQDGSPTGGQPLAEGVATTPFSLKLPAGAACSGDSTEEGYRVQSLMVPDHIDPAALTFGALGPLPKGLGADFRQPLFAVSTTAFANAATNLADEPGGSGTIINIPSFDLGVFSGYDLPAGRYTIGIACTKGPASPTQLDRYWTAAFEVTGGGTTGHAWTAPSSAPQEGAALEAASATTAATSTPDSSVPVEPGGASTASASGAGPDEQPGETAPEPAGLEPTGAPPSFSFPAAEIVSELSITGGATTSLLVWLVAALLSARLAFLLARAARPVPLP